MANTVRIANPLPGGSAYTTTKSAQRFVARGLAKLDGSTLRFHDEVFTRQDTFTARQAQDRDVDARAARNGRIWWNGCRGARSMYPPFCNVQYPSPAGF